MTVWAKKEFTADQDWTEEQQRLGELQKTMLAPHDLMMLRKAGSDGHDTIVLGLPNRQLLMAFPGFTEIERSEVPDGLAVLVSRDDEFVTRFPDIAAKLLPGRK